MKIAIALLVLLLSVPAFASDAPPLRPDPAITPGVAQPGVTAANLCPVAHTPALRDVSDAEKNAVYAAYNVPGDRAGYCAGRQGCEIDHLISLEIGGSNDRKNLWPQSYDSQPLNAHVKDKLENKLHALVCAGTIPLEQAQHEIALDWIAAAVRYGVISASEAP